MTETLTATIFDGVTGQAVERSLTKDEIGQIEAIRAESELQKLELQTKKQARESALGKLAALGLTEAEIAAL